jgi:hypothetical protein
MVDTAGDYRTFPTTPVARTIARLKRFFIVLGIAAAWTAGTYMAAFMTAAWAYDEPEYYDYPHQAVKPTFWDFPTVGEYWPTYIMGGMAVVLCAFMGIAIVTFLARWIWRGSVD